MIAIFLADGGLNEAKTSAGAWTAIGQLTGLIGTDLLLIQLLLASRLPWIDKSFGHDRAMAFHQFLGKPVIILISLHAITLTIGYGLEDKLSFVPEIFSMLTSLSDIGWAYVALGLLFVIVGTSLALVRIKLDYDVWFIVHLTAYIAVLASIPHQFSDGQVFGVGTIARFYWIFLYGITALSLITFRFAIPVINSIIHSLVVESVRAEGDGVVSILLRGKDIHKLQARGGQFFMWRFWAKGIWWHAHPFSLSASPTENHLRITIRALGKGSEQLQNIHPGTKVGIEGPYGLFTEMARTSRKIVMIAAGIGITPVRALLEDAEFAPGEATVIVRNTTDDVYHYDELEDIAFRRGVKLLVFEGKRPKDVSTWLPHNVWQTGGTLEKIIPDVKEADIYICGPTLWARSVVEDAKAAGVAKHQIHWERFNW